MKKGFLAQCLLAGLMATASFSSEIAVGSKVLPFTLPSLNGPAKQLTMEKYRNNLVLLNFWASWCKGCKKEMPFLHTLARDKAKDLTVIAVNIDNKEEKARKYIDKFESKMGEASKIKFVYDSKKSLPKSYGFDVVPCSMLVKNGKVLKYYVGSFKEDDEAALLQDIKKASK